ncbi:uncharacterized protein LOC129572740 [Sitodiplosis mosellana]|uniref:uncharacterized protein LOC129572740 n=1 Tax=Sitodiplosis mosellana TaxID=263140 RepID=UPI002444C8D2|nr:uncharacterized protein LOC129572740 [Sitodiplosis mosellana]
MEEDRCDERLVNELKLTDINVDCLEHIFMHSTVDDFVNIAHTNTQLKPAADLAFARKFGKKKFYFRVESLYPDDLSLTGEEWIIVHDLQTSLRLLRCYGHLILRLHIDYQKQLRPAPIKVLRYVNKFCYESLVEISFHGIFKFAFESAMKKPFSNVQKASFTGCHLGTRMTRFNDWYPALRRLDLIHNRFDDAPSIAEHIPNLEHLTFVGGGKISATDILAVVRVNPQMLSLSLNRVYSARFFRVPSETLPQLESLELRGYPDDFATFNGDVVNFRTVKKLEIIFKSYGGITQWVSTIKLSFNRLEEITMDLDIYSWVDELTDFLKRHQSIRIVNLRWSNENTDAVSDYTLSEIAQALPLLVELNFFGPGCPIDSTIRLLNNLKLMSYGFSVIDRLEFDYVKTKLGNKWEASIDGRRVQVLRAN